MDKGRLILVSTIATVLIIIYVACALDVVGEEDKSESKYMKAFGNVFIVISVIYERFR